MVTTLSILQVFRSGFLRHLHPISEDLEDYEDNSRLHNRRISVTESTDPEIGAVASYVNGGAAASHTPAQSLAALLSDGQVLEGFGAGFSGERWNAGSGSFGGSGGQRARRSGAGSEGRHGTEGVRLDAMNDAGGGVRSGASGGNEYEELSGGDSLNSPLSGFPSPIDRNAARSQEEREERRRIMGQRILRAVARVAEMRAVEAGGGGGRGGGGRGGGVGALPGEDVHGGGGTNEPGEIVAIRRDAGGEENETEEDSERETTATTTTAGGGGVVARRNELVARALSFMEMADLSANSDGETHEYVTSADGFFEQMHHHIVRHSLQVDRGAVGICVYFEVRGFSPTASLKLA